MKESHGEGLASHAGPESCGGGGNTAAEALTGVCAGPVLSSEIKDRVSGADRLMAMGRQHAVNRVGKRCSGLTESKTRCMYRSTLCGNREIPRLALAWHPGSAWQIPREHGHDVRSWEVGQVHSTGEAANKGIGVPILTERVEERDLAKGKRVPRPSIRHSAGKMLDMLRVFVAVRLGRWLPATLGPANAFDPRQEPYEVVPHVRICTGDRP